MGGCAKLLREKRVPGAEINVHILHSRKKNRQTRFSSKFVYSLKTSPIGDVFIDFLAVVDSGLASQSPFPLSWWQAAPYFSFSRHSRSTFDKWQYLLRPKRQLVKFYPCLLSFTSPYFLYFCSFPELLYLVQKYPKNSISSLPKQLVIKTC